ncbi:hypothetical protein [Collimonas sp.]|jgi:hypothetical protein|uniref:hypothetical protein n=1 Tax=Collimonas sp. TaxID=1963772 RepID=UPI002CF222E6|nr:hypothetical protein [Collimonas sp.]HWX02494.1 hypothetical protein [Collimonas sp.]
MTEKTAFHGDVSQAVVGSVHEAPRLSNIVQIIGGASVEPEPQPPKFLTGLQRKAIFEKVKEVATSSGMSIHDVYNVIKNEHGVIRIEQVPLESYKAVMALLNNSLAETNGTSAPEIEEIETMPAAANIPELPLSCIACAEKASANKKLTWTALALTGGLMMLAAGCGWLLYKMPTDIPQATAVPTETICHNDGKSYSVGSTAKILNVGIRECVVGETAGTPRWDDLQKNRMR